MPGGNIPIWLRFPIFSPLLLGLSAGSKLGAQQVLETETQGILPLGIVAFSLGTLAGMLMGKLMNLMPGTTTINPLIGAAGVLIQFVG